MKTVKVDIQSISPYSSSRQHQTPKLSKERPDDYEKRTWREQCNYGDDQVWFIPAMAFKQCLDAMALKSGEQIPGRGRSTYTKFFLSDVICNGNVSLGVPYKDSEPVSVSCNPQGRRGGGKRVQKIFPQIEKWKATAEFSILDDTVTREVFERMLTASGLSIGVGRFRAGNGGLNGRFKPTKFSWMEG